MIPASRIENGRRRSGKRLSWTSRSEQGTRLLAKYCFRADRWRLHPRVKDPRCAKLQPLACRLRHV
jgi:hypothetical protein